MLAVAVAVADTLNRVLYRRERFTLLRGEHWA
jgi:hypothetical protein